MARKKHPVLVLTLIIFFCSIVGGIYGSRIPVAVAAEPGELTLGKDNEVFHKFYNLVDQNFAEPLKPEKAIYRGAIPGMLRALDPHSAFFDPRSYQELRDEQKGTYFGVGMHVAARGGKVVVVTPFAGSPAYKAGLRPGDIIVLVNDKSTENMTTSDVADLLKGPRGTPVKVVVSREGAEDFISINVIRDEISRKSVPDAFWLRREPNIAYVKILNFGENTYRELEENLRRLGEYNIQGMVLDLRGNGGGLLNAGVAVSDRFLQKNQLIVSHHGRSAPERPYIARNGNRGRDYPVVVLVDRYSASAAEIVSGAMQDHDRAWIMGETTFGKGLVQTVFPLRYSTALALTIAHFYTPSGRLIQRDYTNKSFYDYYYRKDDNARNPLDVKMTDSGRTVYGGGGITPDEKIETPKLDTLQAELLRNGLFQFTRAYFAKHSTDLPKGWMPDAKVLDQLHEFLIDKGVKFAETDFLKNQDWIRRYLAKEMYIYAFDEEASDRVFIETDPVVDRALKSMPKAVALVQTARKVIVERMTAQPPKPSVAQR